MVTFQFALGKLGEFCVLFVGALLLLVRRGIVLCEWLFKCLCRDSTYHMMINLRFPGLLSLILIILNNFILTYLAQKSWLPNLWTKFPPPSKRSFGLNTKLHCCISVLPFLLKSICNYELFLHHLKEVRKIIRNG